MWLTDVAHITCIANRKYHIEHPHSSHTHSHHNVQHNTHMININNHMVTLYAINACATYQVSTHTCLCADVFITADNYHCCCACVMLLTYNALTTLTTTSNNYIPHKLTSTRMHIKTHKWSTLTITCPLGMQTIHVSQNKCPNHTNVCGCARMCLDLTLIQCMLYAAHISCVVNNNCNINQSHVSHIHSQHNAHQNTQMININNHRLTMYAINACVTQQVSTHTSLCANVFNSVDRWHWGCACVMLLTYNALTTLNITSNNYINHKPTLTIMYNKSPKCSTVTHIC